MFGSLDGMDGKRVVDGDIGVSHSGGVDLILGYLDLIRGFGGLVLDFWESIGRALGPAEGWRYVYRPGLMMSPGEAEAELGIAHLPGRRQWRASELLLRGCAGA